MTELMFDDVLPVASPPVEWAVLLDDWKSTELAPAYRIPERDAMSSGKPSLKEGDVITFSRVVVRVGYEIGVHSVTKAQWFEAGATIIAKRTQQPIEVVKKIIAELGVASPFKGIRNSIYDELIRPMIPTTKPENRNRRAMWFYDFAHPRVGQIIGTTVKLTGVRDPGGPSGYYGEDYEPPVLCTTGRQVLYKVRDHNPDPVSYEALLVYPLDAKERTR